MAKTLLKRILGRPDERSNQAKAFRLPGALHEDVRVLLVDSGDLTDLLFAMPFVERTRLLFPGARIGLLCDERTSGVALASGAFADLVVYEAEQLRGNGPALRRLEDLLLAERWEIAVLIGQRPDPPRERLAFASQAVLRVGPGHDGAYPDLNCELRPQPAGRHPYQRTVTWGRLLGVPLEGVPLRWPLSAEGRRQMAQVVHFNKPRKDQLLVAVDPGVGKTGALLAPENLAFVMNHLAAHIRCKTIVLTADPEPGRAESLNTLLRGEVLDLARPSLREVVLLLSQCDLFVAGNSDLFHYAVAIGVPTIGIFTPGDGSEWAPPDAEKLEILRPAAGEPLSLSEVMQRVDRLLS